MKYRLLLSLILVGCLVLPLTASASTTIQIFPKASGYCSEMHDYTWSEAYTSTGYGIALNETSEESPIFIRSSSTTNQYDYLRRYIGSFDTSAIPDDATINSAVFVAYTDSYHPTAYVSPILTKYALTGGVLATNTTVVAGDYDGFYSDNTLYTNEVLWSDLTGNGWQTWTLNSAGVANISKTSYTVLFGRMSYDYTNTAPTWGQSGNSSGMMWYGGAATDTAKRLYLNVTYTEAEAPATTNTTTKLVIYPELETGINHYHSGSTWSVIAYGDANYVTAYDTNYLYLKAGSSTNKYNDHYRHIQLYNLSTIPTGANISSALLSFVPSSNADTSLNSTGTLVITGGLLLDNTTFYGADYLGYDQVMYAAEYPLSSISSETRTNLTITNLSFLNRNSGTYKPLYFRSGNDYWNVTPTYTYSTDYLAFSGHTVNESTKKPFIEVTYDAPPESHFTSDYLGCGGTPLTLGFTDTSTSTPLTWNWYATDVAGNNTATLFSTSQNPSQAFTTGNYSIQLNTTNNNGFNMSPANSYWVNVSESIPAAPVSLFTYDYNSGISPLIVQFTDISLNNPYQYKWYATNTADNATGVIFNTTKNPSQVFTTGNWQIKLNASHCNGGTNTSVFWVNVSAPTYPAPVPAFTANTTLCHSPCAVSFTDSSATNILGWNWTFGAANHSTESNPTYTFVGNALYSVTLEAVNASGYNTTTKTNYINVTSNIGEPVASFTKSRSVVRIPQSVTITDTSTNTPTGLQISWGDGSANATTSPVTHQYKRPGLFTVGLTATNAAGSGTTSSTVRVVQSPIYGFVPVDPAWDFYEWIMNLIASIIKLVTGG
jgi:PKD repeat protein